MGEVYEKGIQPVSQDGSKALECYERALALVDGDRYKEALHESTLYIRFYAMYYVQDSQMETAL